MGEVEELIICSKCSYEGQKKDFRTPQRKGKDGKLYYGYCKKCHGEMSRSHRYKALYNITSEEYEKILAFQKGKCWICDRFPKPNKRLAVDHDHKTGLIRGLLCWGCNKALGSFRDDQYRLWSAFLYLFSPPAVEALGEPRYGIVGRVKKKAKNRKLGGAELATNQYRANPEALIKILQDRFPKGTH